jgi:lipopolysaccharide biosynthesis glycosyltransferase
MKIAYACDDNYIVHTGISLLSLLDNNKEVEDLTIYLISVNISEDNVLKIQSIVDEYKRKLVVIPFKQLSPNLKLSNLGRHIETVYAKLFFGNIEEADKIIYLDSDIIINDSLQEMWEEDLGDNYFGLVKTITKDYCHALGLSRKDVFYNDGVAVVNAKLLRENNMNDTFIEFIDSYNGNPPVLSEGTINVVCKNRIKTIHPKFNFGASLLMFNNSELSLFANEKEFYSENILDEARKNPVVIHYLSGWFKRPWEIDCLHPLKDKYNYYKAKSYWKNHSLTHKDLPRNMVILKTLMKYLPAKVIKSLMEIKRIAQGK